uniref:Ig-like domain-containing protein n=1 Tax=Poecilia reticulata TaxID=8081 RepID=A0A3P9MSW9_POERE
RWKFSILIKTFFFPALMCDKLTVVSGTEGQMFDFICEYPSDSKNNTKHFCCLDIDESFGQVVRTSKHNEWTREGRVSLYDNTTAGYFIVRLDKLYLNDSGKYHCGDFGSSDHVSPHIQMASLVLNMAKTMKRAGTLKSLLRSHWYLLFLCIWFSVWFVVICMYTRMIGSVKTFLLALIGYLSQIVPAIHSDSCNKYVKNKKHFKHLKGL